MRLEERTFLNELLHRYPERLRPSDFRMRFKPRDRARGQLDSCIRANGPVRQHHPGQILGVFGLRTSGVAGRQDHPVGALLSVAISEAVKYRDVAFSATTCLPVLSRTADQSKARHQRGLSFYRLAIALAFQA